MKELSPLAGERRQRKARGSLRDEIFFLLRTTLKDRPRDHQPPTANSHQPPTATNRQPPTASHQPPPTASGDQPPTANRCQLPPTTNRQPPTATNRQLPTANRQPPPTANRQLPPTMVEHMECPRAFLGNRNTFFFPLRTPLKKGGQSPAPLRVGGWAEIHKAEF